MCSIREVASDARHVYRGWLVRAAAAGLVAASFSGAAYAQGKNPIDLNAPPKLEVELGTRNVAADDEIEFKAILSFASPLNLSQPSTLQVGGTTLQNLVFKPHYTGKNKVLSFWTLEREFVLSNGSVIDVEAKVEILGQFNGRYYYQIKIEVDGVDLENTDLTQPIVVAGTLNGQSFSFTVVPDVDDDDDDD